MTKYTTSLRAEDMGSELNALQYIIYTNIVNTVNTMVVVKVVAVNGDRIDVIPVCKELSNTGEPIDTSILPNIRYIKWQYGQNSFILTPKVGDIGIMIVSKQDTSGLTKEGDSICQTSSVFNCGDGIYLGGIEGLNQEPTQFIKFEDDDITFTGTGTININAKTVNVESETASIKADTATVEATGTTTVKGATVNVEATTALNLGGIGGAEVARVGDSVNLQTGKITSGSTIVKSI